MSGTLDNLYKDNQSKTTNSKNSGKGSLVSSMAEDSLAKKGEQGSNTKKGDIITPVKGV